jgi:hypothetical protein
MLNQINQVVMVIAYNDHQFPTIEVRLDNKPYYKLLKNAREDKGMNLVDFEEALAFALESIKEHLSA